MDWHPALDLGRGNYGVITAFRPDIGNTQYMREATRETISKEKG